MGRLIDTDKLIDKFDFIRGEDFIEKIIEIINKQPTVEAIPKDQYEARLKADMVAMLTEIQLEIEEMDSNHTMLDVWSNQASKEIWNTALKLIEEIIEVRTNNLKGMTKDGERRPNE